MQMQIERWSKRIVLAAIAIAVFSGVTGLIQVWFDGRTAAAIEKYLDRQRQDAVRVDRNAREDAVEEAARDGWGGPREDGQPSRSAASQVDEGDMRAMP